MEKRLEDSITSRTTPMMAASSLSFRIRTPLLDRTNFKRQIQLVLKKTSDNSTLPLTSDSLGGRQQPLLQDLDLVLGGAVLRLEFGEATAELVHLLLLVLLLVHQPLELLCRVAQSEAHDERCVLKRLLLVK